MTTHIKSALPNQKVQEHCKTIKLPFFLRFLPIGQIIKKVKDMEAALFKCVGHHDDLDNFALSMNLAMDVDVDAAGLVKSLKLVEGTSMDITVNVNGNALIHRSSGGPASSHTPSAL